MGLVRATRDHLAIKEFNREARLVSFTAGSSAVS